jgi:hypothetical protein
MTIKPKFEPEETETPETDSDEQRGKENVEPDGISYFVGQQIDVLDSANRWAEAEVDSEHNLLSYLII